MISSSRNFIFVLIQICLLLSQAPVSHTLVIRLIHYLATDSPFLDPTKSTWDLSHDDLEYSMRRASYLTAQTSELAYTGSLSSTRVDAIGSGFLARIEVGSNSLVQHVFMDTGSSLLWINCEPCVLSARWPIFDPKSSTSYARENCMSDICNKTGGMKLDGCYNGRCKYTIRYGSAESQGHLARETFDFGGDTLQNIFFGCSKYTNIKNSNGILGLGANHISFLAQFGAPRFAYCLGNISDHEYAFNTLAIGYQVPPSEENIPLIIEDKYYINLESIAFGGKILDIDPKIFRRVSADYTGGMMVDSGTTYTYIPRVALDKVQFEIIHIMEELLAMSRNDSVFTRGYKLLCYNGIFKKDLWPAVIFRFVGGVTVQFDAENMFHVFDERTLCLAILPSETLQTSVSIMGNIMQQYFYVSFDLEEKYVGFVRIDCREIDYV